MAEKPAEPPAVDEIDDDFRQTVLQGMKDLNLGENNWPDEEQTPDPEGKDVQDPEAETPDPATGDEAGGGETEDQEPTESEEDDSVPTEYFGIDLSDLPSEKRLEVINRFKEQDRYVQSVQRKAAELEKRQDDPQPPAEETPEMPSDDEIMAALGYSPEDPMYEVKKEVALPLAKMQIETAQAVQAMQEQAQIAAFESHWNSTLDQLEATHGKLPITRDQLLDIALENNIFDPVAAYSQIHLEGRKALSQEVEKSRKAMEEAVVKAKEKPKPPSTTRPRHEDAKKSSPSDLLDPEAAALKAANDLQIDWGEALSKVT